MADFQILNYLDKAIVSQESREPKATRTPSVWPSEASAERIDKSEGKIVGKCHRAAYGRMVGWPVPEGHIDPVGAWRFVTGRLIESHVTGLSQVSDPKIYVASGVRHYVDDIYLPFELDLIVKDPITNRGWIVECKTIYGYMASKTIIGEGKPKLDNIMQASLYLLEIKTGKRLKEIIEKGFNERFAAEAKALSEGKEIQETRNRIEVNFDLLNSMHDGPLGAKLLYLTRDDCQRKEFNITVEEEFDGSYYPAVDGMIWKTFTVESIYERFRTLQNYWFVARVEAEKRLDAKGIRPPETLRLVRGYGDKPDISKDLTEKERVAELLYLDKLGREMASLPQSFWPPAEYEFSYSPEKIELLYQRGLIGKAKYKAWKDKKKDVERIGDWQCTYCPYKGMCVPTQDAKLAHLTFDIENFLPSGDINE